MESEYNMNLPELTTYKDIHADMDIPDVTMNRIASYLRSNDKQFEAKVRELYEER